MVLDSNLMDDLKIESITIVLGECLSPVDRAKLDISPEDFAEIRIEKKSPREMKIKAIKKGEKPTEGFRKAITNADLVNETFD